MNDRMSDMDALVEKAARAIEGDVEYVVPKRDGSPLTVAHVRLTHDEALEVARAAISAVGLPALLERVEAAEGEVEFYKSQTATWMNSYKQQVEGARELLADRDTLAAKVADTGERIAQAIEADYEEWRNLGPDGPLSPTPALHSTEWFIQRVTQRNAAIARTALGASETP